MDQRQTETDASICERFNGIVDTLNTLPTDDEYYVCQSDIYFTGVSMISRVISIILTLVLANSYYQNEKYDYFAWTLCCFIIPMFITMFLQLSIYFQDITNDSTKKLKIADILLFVVIFPIIFRYWKTLIYTLRCKWAENKNNKLEQKKYYDLLISEDSDVALIRIFECFLEAAPQKILQISIILSGEDNISVLQVLSLGSSIFSMAWCIASYHRCIRLSQIDKINISWLGSIIQSAWHLSISLSRVLSIAIVANLFPKWTLFCFSMHAILMSWWIFLFDRSPFCSKSIVHSYVFSLILGFVFIFNYILPKVRRTRYRFTIFYAICFIENVICVLLYSGYSTVEDKNAYYFLPLCLLSIIPFLLGILFMIWYYTRFHPNVVSRREYTAKEIIEGDVSIRRTGNHLSPNIAIIS